MGVGAAPVAVPVAVPVAEIVPASGAAALEGVTVAGLAEAPSAVAVATPVVAPMAPRERERATLGALAALPDDVLDGILRMLAPGDLAALACTCAVLYVLCGEEPLWQAVCLRERAEAAVAVAAAQSAKSAAAGESLDAVERTDAASSPPALDFRGSWRAAALAAVSSAAAEAGLRPRVAVGTFGSEFLYARWYRCNVDLRCFLPPVDSVERRMSDELSQAEFRGTYDDADAGRPVMVSGATRGWAAQNEWGSIAALAARAASADSGEGEEAMFRVTSSAAHAACAAAAITRAASGGAAGVHEALGAARRAQRMPLRRYASYAAAQRDEEPLYVFDEAFGETCPALLHEYARPACAEDDLLATLGEERRPPYRWLVAGPARSGASWHVDPARTAAWNALLSGTKRWALYPPGVAPPGVEVQIDAATGAIRHSSPPSLRWFLEVYPYLPPERRPLECVQRPGETIFVPSGWWHCVLNLEESVAVTQNYASRANLSAVCVDLAGRLDAQTRRAFLDQGVPLPPPPPFRTQREARGLLRAVRAHSLGAGAGASGLGAALLAAADASVEASALWARVEVACARHGVDARAEWADGASCPPLPAESGSSPVFVLEGAGVCVKLYVDAPAGRPAAERTLEEGALAAIAARGGLVARVAPPLVAAGLLEYEYEGEGEGAVERDESAAAASEGFGRHARLAAGAAHTVGVRGAGGGLAYLIVGLCEGRPLRRAWSNLSDATGAHVARQLGAFAAELHAVDVPDELVAAHAQAEAETEAEAGDDAATFEAEAGVPAAWRPFVRLLRARRAYCTARQRMTSVLPKALADEIEAYVPADPVSLLDLSVPPVLMHSDLTDENVLVSGDGDAAVLRVIDFGDARCGHALYDLVAVALSALQADAGRLAAFVAAYAEHGGQRPLCAGLAPGVRTARAALCMCLLHEQDAVMCAYGASADARAAESLDELAQALFGGVRDA